MVTVSSKRNINEPFLKHPLDMALSFLMIVMSLSVSIPIALAIKIEDGGPVFTARRDVRGNGTGAE